jgi:hypothetical protein
MILITSERNKIHSATKEVNPDLREPGMVTDACWTDYNGDNWPDLLLIGEWMPIRLFENRRGKLVEVKDSGLEETQGLWAKILAEDFDKDGDTDFVVGNMGTNVHGKPLQKNPSPYTTTILTEMDA